MKTNAGQGSRPRWARRNNTPLREKKMGLTNYTELILFSLWFPVGRMKNRNFIYFFFYIRSRKIRPLHFLPPPFEPLVVLHYIYIYRMTVGLILSSPLLSMTSGLIPLNFRHLLSSPSTFSLWKWLFCHIKKTLMGLLLSNRLFDFYFFSFTISPVIFASSRKKKSPGTFSRQKAPELFFF